MFAPSPAVLLFPNSTPTYPPHPHPPPSSLPPPPPPPLSLSRRVNEDLRVAKARVAKYREIQAELEAQLARSQASRRT